MSKYRITLEGKSYEMEVDLVGETAAPQPAVKNVYKELKRAVNNTTVRVMDPSAKKQTVNHTGAVTAPMPGTVIRIEKTVGDAVKAGEIVLILEAMKMENEILTPVDGTIAAMNCTNDSVVASGEVLFEVK